MTLKQRILPLALLAVFSVGAVAPQTLSAQNTAGQKRQKNKNDWRNLGAAAGAIAGYSLLKGDSTATVLGAAGAAYSAKRYEDERKAQSAAQRSRARYHRTDGNDTRGGVKYYRYNGHKYSMDLATGERRQLD